MSNGSIRSTARHGSIHQSIVLDRDPRNSGQTCPCLSLGSSSLGGMNGWMARKTDKCQQPYRGRSNMRSYWKLGGSSEEWDRLIGISSSSDRGSIPRSEPGSQERTGDLGRGMEEADQGPFAFDGEWVFLRKCIGMRAGTQCPCVRAGPRPEQSMTDGYEVPKNKIPHQPWIEKPPFPLGPDILFHPT